MPAEKNEAAASANREIVTTRLFDAPRQLVFEAWTDPKHVAQWWGPRGFTNTIHEMDVRPGGVWRLTMHGPDGVDYPNRIVFTEVVKPERLVYDHGSREGDPGEFHVTVTFAEESGKTRLTMRALRFGRSMPEGEGVRSGRGRQPDPPAPRRAPAEDGRKEGVERQGSGLRAQFHPPRFSWELGTGEL